MGGRKMAESFTAVSEIVQEVQTGENLLHSLIYDRYEGGGVESVERSLIILEGILDEVAEGRGLLHTLIYEPTSEQDLVTGGPARPARGSTASWRRSTREREPSACC